MIQHHIKLLYEKTQKACYIYIDHPEKGDAIARLK